MEPASRTPEGDANTCSVCGFDVIMEPSQPAGDAPCPVCGTLLWFMPRLVVPDTIEQLAERGAFVEIDAAGEITLIRFSGDVYKDSAVPQLARIEGVRILDISDTQISSIGAQRLRVLMPDVRIIHG